MAIVDHRGNPIKTANLNKELAAPSLSGIRSVWTASNMSGGLTPGYLAATLKSAAEGDNHDYLVLAEEMEEREPHYASVLGTRKRAISGIRPEVEAFSDDKKDVDLANQVRNMVRRPAFGELTDDLVDGLGKGYSVAEIIWQRGQLWQPTYIWRDPKFFTFDKETGSKILLLDVKDEQGIELEAYKFITHIPKLKSGLPVRAGLARLASVSYMCKSWTLKDWMAFADVFGMPLRLGKYGPGADEEQIQTLVRAVANIGSDAAAVIPKSMEVDFVGGNKSGGGTDLFLQLAEWLDKQVSKAVLGQTMTADDGSSQSQATVHNEVRMDILHSDVKQLANTLNRDLVKPFIDLNFGVQENYPTITFPIAEPEDLALLAASLEKLVPLGLEVEASVIRDKLGLPDPDYDNKGNPVGKLLASNVGSTSVEQGLNHTHHCQQCATSSALNLTEPQDNIDTEVDALLSDWDEITNPISEPVLKLAQEVDNFEDFKKGLAGLVGQMDSTVLIESLALAAFKARIDGNVEEEEKKNGI